MMRGLSALVVSLLLIAAAVSAVVSADKHAPAKKKLKILVYNPMFAYSHMRFMGNLADVLVEAGHEVDVLAPQQIRTFPDSGSKVANATVFRIDDDLVEGIMNFHKAIGGDSWRTSADHPFHILRVMFEMRGYNRRLCFDFLDRENVVEKLRAKKYDVAFSEPFDACGYAIFKLAGIDRYATVLSTVMTEQTARQVGAPMAYSYVPTAFGNYDDAPGFLHRLTAPIVVYAMEQVFGYYVGGIVDELGKRIGQPTITYDDMVADSSLVFTNSEPMIDFPRPTLHKIIDIGGLTMQRDVAPLDSKFASYLSLRNRTVFVSFGSIAKSYLMPQEFKQALLTAFSRRPDVTFIWKYEEEKDRISEGYDNVIEVRWAPQPSLLADPRLSLFVTHGGLGSTTETMSLGCPTLVVPLFGDQMRNARVLQRSGIGELLEKTSLGEADTIHSALGRMLDAADEYRSRATRLAALIKAKPFSARDLLIRNAEFLAEFGPFPQLDPAGRHHSYVKYYLLDVLAVLTAGLFILGAILFYALRSLKRILSAGSGGKQKSAKKED